MGLPWPLPRLHRPSNCWLVGLQVYVLRMTKCGSGDRLFAVRSRLIGNLAFSLRIEFSAKQYYNDGNPHPHHKSDNCSESAVSLVVTSKMAGIPREHRAETFLAHPAGQKKLGRLVGGSVRYSKRHVRGSRKSKYFRASGRQIDYAAPHERASVIYPYQRLAAIPIVFHPNHCTERETPMSRSQGVLIQLFTACSLFS